MGHPTRTVFTVLAALLLAACPMRRDEGRAGSNATDASRPEAPGTDTAPPRPSLPDLLAAVHDRTPGGELRVLRQLPPPLEIRREPVRNRHDPTLVDTLVTFIHPGLRLEVYHVTASERDIVRSVEVTGEGYRTADGIGPGSSRGDVAAVLGPPDTVAGPPGPADTVVGTTLVYHGIRGEPGPTPTTLSIELRDERVRRMTWSYYVD